MKKHYFKLAALAVMMAAAPEAQAIEFPCAQTPVDGQSYVLASRSNPTNYWMRTSWDGAYYLMPYNDAKDNPGVFTAHQQADGTWTFTVENGEEGTTIGGTTYYGTTYVGIPYGTDNINGTEIKREFKNEYQIEDEVVGPVVTNALNKVTLTVKYLIDNVETYYDLVLTFDDSQKCTITSGTSGVAISGSGEFVDKGAGKYWGNTDRDQLTLSYTITDGANTIKTSDTLVSQRTGLKFETFSYTYKK